MTTLLVTIALLAKASTRCFPLRLFIARPAAVFPSLCHIVAAREAIVTFLTDKLVHRSL
jgi:hypothetical protein